MLDETGLFANLFRALSYFRGKNASAFTLGRPIPSPTW